MTTGAVLLGEVFYDPKNEAKRNHYTAKADELLRVRRDCGPLPDYDLVDELLVWQTLKGAPDKSVRDALAMCLWWAAEQARAS
jgi:hypothetical protein